MGNASNKSPLRQSLDYLNKKYVDSKVKEYRIEKLKEKIIAESAGLKESLDMLKRQIQLDEDIEDIKDVQPEPPKYHDYEAIIEKDKEIELEEWEEINKLHKALRFNANGKKSRKKRNRTATTPQPTQETQTGSEQNTDEQK